MNWEKELELAKEAAIAAGDLLLKLRQGKIAVLSDKGKDIKLAADKASESLILEVSC